MILFPRLKVALITPPKNASSAIHYGALKIRGATWVESRSIGNADLICCHTIRSPEFASGFRRLIVLRNPVDRACSLFCHAGTLPGFSLSFREFIEQILLNDADFFAPQWRYDPDATATPVPLESFSLRKFGIKLKPDSRNANKTLVPKPRPSPGELLLVKEWASRDFERWGQLWPNVG